MYLCDPSQVGIFLDCPQTQSWKPFPFRIRWRYCSILDVRVLDCLGELKYNRYPRCLPGVSEVKAF